VIAGVRPSRPNGKSEAWEMIAAEHEQIKAWLDRDLTLTKVHTLLGRRGVVVSYRTLHRYATVELGFGRRQPTVRVADCEPGAEVQVDFGRLGMLTDAADGRRRVVQGLIFTAVYSRHMFVWPTYRQTRWTSRRGREALPAQQGFPAGRSMSGCGSGGPSVRPAAGCGMGPRPSPPATRTTAATGAHVHTCVAFGSSRCVDPVSSGGARQAWVMVRSADRMLSRPSRAPGCLARTTQGRTRPG
jgi:hypothetical protein